MDQMPEGQFFGARFFLPALCANVTVLEVMTMAFNQVHCIRLAYLHRKLEIVLCDSTAPYPSFRMRVVKLRSRQSIQRNADAGNNPLTSGCSGQGTVIELLARDACCLWPLLLGHLQLLS
jgi:hypothetical protein